jgi:hypothetical protein
MLFFPFQVSLAAHRQLSLNVSVRVAGLSIETKALAKRFHFFQQAGALLSAPHSISLDLELYHCKVRLLCRRNYSPFTNQLED